MKYVDKVCPETPEHTEGLRARLGPKDSYCPVCGRKLQSVVKCSHARARILKETWCSVCGERTKGAN